MAHWHSRSISMFSRRYIPQELCDEIIDHVGDDMLTLLACATTCRSWVWRSQKNIFRVVTIANTARFDRFARLVKSNSRLAAYVRVLTIGKARRSRTKMDKLWPELLSRLPRIEELTLGRWLDLSLAVDAVQQNQDLTKYLQHVRILRIADSYMECGGEFARLLAACPKMRRLDLDGAYIQPRVGQERVSVWPTLPEHVDTLRYRPTHVSGSILRCWLSSPLAANIRRLELELATPALFHVCGPLLSATEHILEELSLCIPLKKVPRRQHIHFTPMPLMKRLRRISLRTKTIDLEKPTARQYEWMYRFLEMLSRWEGKSGVQEVALSWRTSDISEMGSTSLWKSFDTAFANLAKEHSKLKLVLNVLDDSGIPNQWLYIVSIGLQLFPRLQEQTTSLFVNMSSSWCQDDAFGGCLGNPKQNEFKYPCPPVVKVVDQYGSD